MSGTLEGIGHDIIVVTNWERVSPDDFYLSREWEESSGYAVYGLKARAKRGELYIAYEVPAKSYALYVQMDASQIIIDREGNHVLSCESAVIGNEHKTKWEADL